MGRPTLALGAGVVGLLVVIAVLVATPGGGSGPLEGSSLRAATARFGHAALEGWQQQQPQDAVAASPSAAPALPPAASASGSPRPPSPSGTASPLPASVSASSSVAASGTPSPSGSGSPAAPAPTTSPAVSPAAAAAGRCAGTPPVHVFLVDSRPLDASSWEAAGYHTLAAVLAQRYADAHGYSFAYYHTGPVQHSEKSEGDNPVAGGAKMNWVTRHGPSGNLRVTAWAKLLVAWQLALRGPSDGSSPPAAATDDADGCWPDAVLFIDSDAFVKAVNTSVDAWLAGTRWLPPFNDQATLMSPQVPPWSTDPHRSWAPPAWWGSAAAGSSSTAFPAELLFVDNGPWFVRGPTTGVFVVRGLSTPAGRVAASSLLAHWWDWPLPTAFLTAPPGWHWDSNHPFEQQPLMTMVDMVSQWHLYDEDDAAAGGGSDDPPEPAAAAASKLRDGDPVALFARHVRVLDTPTFTEAAGQFARHVSSSERGASASALRAALEALTGVASLDALRAAVDGVRVVEFDTWAADGRLRAAHQALTARYDIPRLLRLGQLARAGDGTSASPVASPSPLVSPSGTPVAAAAAATPPAAGCGPGAPAPSVTSVAPDAVRLATGGPITVTGAGFCPGVQCEWTCGDSAADRNTRCVVPARDVSTSSVVCDFPAGGTLHTNDDGLFHFPFSFGGGFGGVSMLRLRQGGDVTDDVPVVGFLGRELPPPGQPLATTEASLTESAASLRALIQSTQYPDDCSTVPYVTDRLRRTGLGMETFRLALGFGCALSKGLLYVPTSGWGYEDGCSADTGFECLFQRPTHCVLPPPAAAAARVGNATADAPPPPANRVLSPANGVDIDERCREQLSQPLSMLTTRYGEFTRAPEGWVASVLTAHLLRPQPVYADAVAALHAGPAAWAAQHAGAGCIAVHVRQGERGNGNIGTPQGRLPRWELAHVLAPVRAVAAATGARHVFFASDSDALMAAAGAHVAGSDGLTLHTLAGALPHAHDGADCLREQVVGCGGDVSPHGLRLALVADLLTLSKCAVVVGTLRSSFTRVALALGIGTGAVPWPAPARGNALTPAWSLE